jgi:hypothetical protein
LPKWLCSAGEGGGAGEAAATSPAPCHEGGLALGAGPARRPLPLRRDASGVQVGRALHSHPRLLSGRSYRACLPPLWPSPEPCPHRPRTPLPRSAQPKPELVLLSLDLGATAASVPGSSSSTNSSGRSPALQAQARVLSQRCAAAAAATPPTDAAAQRYVFAAASATESALGWAPPQVPLPSLAGFAQTPLEAMLHSCTHCCILLLLHGCTAAHACTQNNGRRPIGGLVRRCCCA